jgi:AcrR family transcriptional regulator
MDNSFREKALEEAKSDEKSTKARILKAAEGMFARNGYSGTTTREIVEEAGVNIALLHYHWGSKEELWNAVHHDLLSRAYGQVKETAYEIADKDPRQAIRTVIDKFFNYCADNPNVALLMQQPKFAMDRPWTRDLGEPAFNELLQFVGERTDLDFGPVDPGLALYMIIGALEFFFIRPDLVQLYFGEDSGDYSGQFREKACGAIFTMIERFGRIETENGDS